MSTNTRQAISFAVDGAIARLTLDRPAVRNAMNGQMYDEAREVLREVESRPDVRVLILTGAGSTFCSGGDLQYQQAQATRPHEDRLQEAAKFSLWLRELDELSKPVVGRINGLAFGGGMGLVACCDIAIADEAATFCLPEVSIGLVPSMISPFVVARIGAARARTMFLNAKVLRAEDALSIGLIDEVAPNSQLDEVVQRHAWAFLRCAPGAVADTKRLIREVAGRTPQDSHERTVALVARMWASAEAIEGIGSFLQKRQPSWRAQ